MPEENASAVPHVYTAINNVQKELCKIGITKDSKNSQQGYNFRGIDDIYNVVSPILASCGLVIVPQHKNIEQEKHTNNKGTVLFYTRVMSEYDIISVLDGSSHKAYSLGEGMDSGDKATNKAMTASYKYMVMQLFAIPTAGDNDADATSHVIVNSDAGKLMLVGAARFISKDAIKAAANMLGIDPNNCTPQEAEQIIQEAKQSSQ